jgi:hypothetical protein
MAQVPAAAEAPATTPEREDAPKLTAIAGGKDGGNGFSEPAKKSRQPVIAAGINAKTEAKATARNAARASKK